MWGGRTWGPFLYEWICQSPHWGTSWVFSWLSGWHHPTQMTTGSGLHVESVFVPLQTCAVCIDIGSSRLPSRFSSWAADPGSSSVGILGLCSPTQPVTGGMWRLEFNLLKLSKAKDLAPWVQGPHLRHTLEHFYSQRASYSMAIFSSFASQVLDRFHQFPQKSLLGPWQGRHWIEQSFGTDV